MSVKQIISESMNRNPLGLKEAFESELRARIALALEAKSCEDDEDEELDEAIKLGSKVRIHAPGKDYHDAVGHVGEYRKHTYGSMAPSFTVDYHKPGYEHKLSVTLPRKNIKLHKE